MKTSKLLILVLFLLGGSLFANVYAQNNLEKWVKKCETSKKEGVNITVISKRDKVTKKDKTKLVSISISGNTGLVSELRDAAAKDRNNAVDMIETKVDGVLKPQIYEFYNDKMKLTTKYIFSFSDRDEATLVVNTSYETRVYCK